MRNIVISAILFGCLMALVGPAQVLAADSVTVTGEVIDTFCYATMGALGENHRECGLDCVKKGISAGMLEDGTKKVYVLLPNKDRSPVPEAAIQKMGRKATITGKVYVSGGTNFLTVESVK